MAPSKEEFYAVKRGRNPGIYSTWKECEEQVKGCSGASYRKFKSAAEAQQYVAVGNPSINPTVPVPFIQELPVTTNKPKDKGKWKQTQSVLEDESGWEVAYTDGACKGNGKSGSVAGVGVWWGPDDPRNIAERCPGDQTNNRAELIAIIRLLETHPISKKPLLIKTDSVYSINCFVQWLPKWIANDFRTALGKEVKNQGIIRYLSALLDYRSRSGHKVRLQYVKGHSGEEGNDGADLMANRGVMEPEQTDRDWDKLRRDLEKEIAVNCNGKDGAKEPNVLEVVRPNESAGDPVLEIWRISSTATAEALGFHRKRKLGSPDPTTPPKAVKSRRSRNFDDKSLAKPTSSLNTPVTSHSRYPTPKSPSYEPSTLSSSYPTCASPPLTATLTAKPSSPNKVNKVLAVSPPVVAVPESDVNFEDYADGILSDEDLAKELEP